MEEILLQTIQKTTHRHAKFLGISIYPFPGGFFFERIVRIVKSMLRKQLRNSKLNFEDLQTLFLEIERIINNRPMTYNPGQNCEKRRFA